jgi:hypothetical protein
MQKQQLSSNFMESLSCGLIKPGGGFYGRKDQKKKLPKMDIFVIRLNSNDELVNSRPCYNCLNMMKAVGIHRIFYSVDGLIECERVTSMISINASSVTRYLEAKVYNAPEDRELYYKSIFIKYLPKTLMYTNFNKFIKYNFTDVLPNYSWKIKEDKIYFYDSKKKYFLSCNIIF